MTQGKYTQRLRQKITAGKMDTPANQPWDFGQAVTEWSTGIVKGVAVFFGL